MKRKLNLKFVLGLCAGFLSMTQLGVARDLAGVSADDSAINQRDKNLEEVTAENQGGSKSDFEITRSLRRSLVKDKRLSLYAHNIKIITQDGVVTLKGPVRSEKEKKIIEARALKVPGCKQVENKMDVTPKR